MNCGLALARNTSSAARTASVCGGAHSVRSILRGGRGAGMPHPPNAERSRGPASPASTAAVPASRATRWGSDNGGPPWLSHSSEPTGGRALRRGKEVLNRRDEAIGLFFRNEGAAVGD